MKEKQGLGAAILIDYLLEIEYECLLNDSSFDKGASFDRENIEKLKRSPAYKSALYYDALKNIH